MKRIEPFVMLLLPGSYALSGLGALIPALILLLLLPPALAQTSQFVFDSSGDLAGQTAETPGTPQIISQPHAQPLIVEAGGLASFSVVLADNTGAGYQWQFDGTNISGATSDTVDVTNAGAADEGEYTVIVDNSFGSVTSAPAMLWYDGNGNGLPDSWEMKYFGNLNQTATGDYDGDGVDNLQEFLDGTNPTNAASVHYRLSVANDGGVVTIVPNQPSYTNGQTVVLTATPAGAFHAWTGAFLSTNNIVTVVMTNNTTVFARFTPVNYVWTNASGGDWNTGNYWNFGSPPRTNDNAVITNGNFTVTVSANIDCNNLTLGTVGFAPTITGSATLTVHGTFNWNSGNMTGSGRTVIAPGATMYVGTNQATLNIRTLENAGTVVWAGNSPIYLTSAVITNDAGALFQALTSEGAGSEGGANRFDNSGTFQKLVDQGTTSFGFGVSFNNYGTVDIESGTLLFNSAFANDGLVTVAAGTTNRIAAGGSDSGGTFSAASGSLVEWTSGTFTLSNGGQLEGTGLYRMNGAVTVTCDNDVPVVNFDVLQGTFSGTGTVTIGGLMNCISASMSGSGRTVIAPDATLNLSELNMSGWILENDGTTYWNGTSAIFLNSSIVTNAPGALFQAQKSAQLSSGGGVCRFDNSGFFQKVSDPGATSFASGVLFNNYSTVDIQTGTLNLSYGGVNNGAITIEGGAAFSLPSGTFSSSSGSSITGAGSLTVNGGTANLAGLVSLRGTNTCAQGAANFTGICFCTNNVLNISGGTANFSGAGVISPSVLNLTGGTLTGTNRVTVLNTMNWTSGTMDDSGGVLIAPAATLTASNSLLLYDTLENAGHAVWTGTATLETIGGIITNDAGALFDVQNNYQFSREGGSSRFDNSGTFRKSVVDGTTSFSGGFALNNYGTVDIEAGIVSAGGGFSSASAALLNCTIGGTIPGTNYGQLQVSGSVMLAGALSVNFINGYTPSTNTSFTVLTAGARTGAFSNFSYPSNQVTMQVSNAANAVIVQTTGVAPPPPAPIVLSLTLLGTNADLVWNAVSNTTYRLEYDPALTLSNWNAVPGDITSLSNVASKLDPLTVSNRFYRVLVLP